MTLRALNRLANEQGWEAVSDCFETDSVGSLEDDRNQNIFRRILKRHSESVSLELQFIKWCGTAHFPMEFAEVASSLALGNLDKRGFLSATTRGYARVHDLVYRAVVSEIIVSSANKERFRQRLGKFVREKSDRDRILLQRMARLQSDLFRRLLSEIREPAVVYMVALNRSDANAISLLGNPADDARAMVLAPSSEENFIKLRAIIESVEALFTLRTEFRAGAEAREKLEGDMLAFETLMSHNGLTDNQRSMLRHHHAKMLVKLGRRDEAKVSFQAILAADPSSAKARIQLARLLPSEESILECERLLEQYREGPGAMSINVIIEALRFLAFRGADMSKHGGVLTQCIQHASSADPFVAVRLVSSVAQRAWLAAPQIIFPMFEAVDWQGLTPGPDEAFDWAQVHKYASMVVQSDVTRAQLLGKALQAYGIARLTKEYELTHYSEALILASRYQDAVAQLDSIAEHKREAFWWQRRAQALVGLSFQKEALAAINVAVSSLKDSSLLPVFLWDRYLIRLAGGDEHAAQDLEAAIPLLRVDSSFRKQIEQRLVTHTHALPLVT